MSSNHELSTSWALSSDSSKPNKLLKHVVHGVGSASLLVAPVAFAQLPPASGEVDVNTATGDRNEFGGRRAQGVAVAPDGDAIVVWERTQRYNYGAGSSDVYVRLFDQTGTPLTGEILVAEGGDPSVAVDGDGNFVVGFERPQSTEEYSSTPAMRLFDDSGTPTSGVINIDTNPSDNLYSDDVDVAMSPDGNIAASWERCCGPSYNYSNTIWVRTFNAGGTPTSAPVRASADFVEGTFLQEPAVAMDADGDFVTSWESYVYDEGYTRQLLVRRFNANGTPAAAEQVVATNYSENSLDPDVAMNLAGDFAVSFDETNSVYVFPYGYGRDVKMRIYNADGSPRTGVLDVDAAQAVAQNPQDASVAMGENRVAVTWHADRSGADNTEAVFLRTFNTAGLPDGPTQLVNITEDDSEDPSVGIDPHGDLVAVGWEADSYADLQSFDDIRLRMFGEIREKTPPAPAVPVPTLDRIGLLLMAGLTGLFGWFGLRRRRIDSR